MPSTDHKQSDLVSFIESHRKAGTTDEQITIQLLQAGWPLDQVSRALLDQVPTPPSPVTNNMSAQTGNAGTPLQVENVQYNMKMRPVQSKVGLYIRIAGISLWLTAFFIAYLLSVLVQKLSGSFAELSNTLVFTISLSVVTIPIFLISYKKFLSEQKRNPASIDDIFFKQSIRQGLWLNIVLGAGAAVLAVYQLLATMFLPDSGATYANSFSALYFALGFGSVILFYWRLHAKTQR